MVAETMNAAPVPPEHHFATKADLASVSKANGSFRPPCRTSPPRPTLAQMETRLLLRLGALIVALNGLTIAILKFLG